MKQTRNIPCENVLVSLELAELKKLEAEYHYKFLGHSCDRFRALIGRKHYECRVCGNSWEVL
jgi:hypothetical protein